MRSQTQASEWQGKVRKYAEAQDWTSAMSIVDRQAAAAPIAGKAATALAEGFIGRAVAESRHAFPFALRPDWLFRSALLVGL